MDKHTFTRIRSYIRADARPLDTALFNFKFNNGNKQVVLDELKKYQNDDGGFAHGIEPDLRTELSTVISTTVALQYLFAVDANHEDPLVASSIKYLSDNYDGGIKGWRVVNEKVDYSPHAPWWDYKRTLEYFGWGNPSAEVLGYLLAYPALATEIPIELLKEEALNRLNTIDTPEFHELKCYVKLFNIASQDYSNQLIKPLAKLIKEVTMVNPDEWGSYGATPLTFLHSPQDELASTFDADLVAKNLQYIIDSLCNDHWEPVWNWGNNYPEAWLQAKKDWSGKITVDNLVLLKNFGLTP